MSLFKSKATIVSELEGKLEASDVQIAELEGHLKTSTDEVKTSSESSASLTEQLAEMTTENAGLESNVALLTADLATANKSLEDSEAKQAGFDEKVEAAALVKIGSAGHGEPLPDADLGGEADENLESAIKAMNAAKTGAERHTASLKVTELRNKELTH